MRHWRLKGLSRMKQPFNPFEPSRCINASFYIPENRLNFPTTKGFRTKMYMKMVYQYMVIFFTFPTTLNHFHPLQVENCGSNSQLVVDEDDNDKFRPERVNIANNSYSQRLVVKKNRSTMPGWQVPQTRTNVSSNCHRNTFSLWQTRDVLPMLSQRRRQWTKIELH